MNVEVVEFPLIQCVVVGPAGRALRTHGPLKTLSYSDRPCTHVMHRGLHGCKQLRSFVHDRAERFSFVLCLPLSCPF